MRQNVLRKAKPIALLRKEYSQTGARTYGDLQTERQQRLGEKLRPGPRRVADVYHGWDVIVKAAEGNPRWLIYSMVLLLEGVRGSRDLIRRPVVPPRKQAIALRRVSDRFGSYLNALSELSLRSKAPQHHIWTLLEHVGRSFHKRLVDPDSFPLDPAASFTVDARTSDGLAEKLRNAEFEGGIVDLSYGPDFDPPDSVRGRSFRLSYRLSPRFGMTMRKCESVSLTRILSSHRVLAEYCTLSEQPRRRPVRVARPVGTTGRARHRERSTAQPTLPITGGGASDTD